MAQVPSRTSGGVAPGAIHRAHVDLPSEIFDVAVNIPLIHQVVVAQRAAARQGTHSTKTRGQVRGGGKKPYKQKGTGRARQGSTRAPQFSGGGTIHGPKPRDYSQRTPKKMKAAALRSALSDRAQNDRVHVIESFGLGDKPSTKAALAGLRQLTERSKYLVVLERADIVTWLSLRNAAEVHIVAVDQLNTYDVLASDDVVFTVGAFNEFIATRWPTENSRGNDRTSRSYRRSEGARQFDTSIAGTGVATATESDELVRTGIGQTSDRSQLLDAAHQAARKQMGKVQSYRSTDPTIDGWSVSSEDVEFVAIERHNDHVLITWPSTLTAGDAIQLFQSMARTAEAVYAEAGDDYVAFDVPGAKVDWERIAKMRDLRFLRAERGSEILVWKAPYDDLHDNRFQVIESSVETSRLVQLIRQTTNRDVVSLLERYLGSGKLDFEPLRAVG